MSNEIVTDEVVMLRQKISKMAEIAALSEITEEKFKQSERALESLLISAEQNFNSQISKMNSALNEQVSQLNAVILDCKEIMSEVGAHRLRNSLQDYTNQSKEHLKNIHLATDEFVRFTDESVQRLNQATDYTLKGLLKAIQSFKMDDFQKVAISSVETVNEACNKSVSRISRIIKWFHWRNVALVGSISIGITVISGLYMTDEWPWESHQQVVQQRQLAIAVETAWPHLSSQDQQEILHTATQSIA